MTPDLLQQAVALLRDADSLLITAGAGMGVDSGLPDFRGNEGFWQAYPALAQARLQFAEVASPDTFRRDPALAWGFYGHRLHLYRRIEPHAGFDILNRWATRFARGAFVFTSNVDGQFQKAGWDPDRIVECHGSIHHLQCLDACLGDTWVAASVDNPVDEAACRMLGELPRCRHCEALARPNILMFGDGEWVASRTAHQEYRFRRWCASLQRPVVLELGAGTAIPSARHAGERLDAPVIRVNPREWQVEGRGVGLASGALAALQALDALWA
ncbi:MAG: SIR2 family NAD-dependent protein deacylase [Pseudomonadota bacterium]